MESGRCVAAAADRDLVEVIGDIEAVAAGGDLHVVEFLTGDGVAAAGEDHLVSGLEGDLVAAAGDLDGVAVSTEGHHTVAGGDVRVPDAGLVVAVTLVLAVVVVTGAALVVRAAGARGGIRVVSVAGGGHVTGGWGVGCAGLAGRNCLGVPGRFGLGTGGAGAQTQNRDGGRGDGDADQGDLHDVSRV